MYGHSLHAQLASGGSGMSSLSGAAFAIWCKMPASVATMSFCAVELDRVLEQRGRRADEVARCAGSALRTRGAR